ncbi:MAG: DUF5654 family protein [Patescibacteria group bacterium]|jgi:hypothetical protein
MAIEDKKPGETEQEKGLRLSVIQKTLELMTAAFSLVAALAWNDAIQTLFLRLFGPASSLWAKILYALLITALVVWIGIRLSRVTKAAERRYTKH